jgi:hypothetical protein
MERGLPVHPPGREAAATRSASSSASRSASYHMLSAAAAPAPKAMHRIAVKASAGGSEDRRDQQTAQAGGRRRASSPAAWSRRGNRASRQWGRVVIAALFITHRSPLVQGVLLLPKRRRFAWRRPSGARRCRSPAASRTGGRAAGSTGSIRASSRLRPMIVRRLLARASDQKTLTKKTAMPAAISE